MNLRVYEWAADRAIEQEGSVQAAVALYRRLIDMDAEGQTTDVMYIQSCRRTLAILEERLEKETATID